MPSTLKRTVLIQTDSNGPLTLQAVMPVTTKEETSQVKVGSHHLDGIIYTLHSHGSGWHPLADHFSSTHFSTSVINLTPASTSVSFPLELFRLRSLSVFSARLRPGRENRHMHRRRRTRAELRSSGKFSRPMAVSSVKASDTNFYVRILMAWRGMKYVR